MEEAAVAAVFFSGRPFPAWEETTLQVGGTLLWRIVAEFSGRSEAQLTAAYREHGDLGAVAGTVLPDPTSRHDSAHPAEIQKHVPRNCCGPRRRCQGGACPPTSQRISPLEAKYIIKIMTGDLRIGLKESLVEEAIAKAFREKRRKKRQRHLKAVQRANMLLGDIGETLKLAAKGALRGSQDAPFSSHRIHAGEPG